MHKNAGCGIYAIINKKLNLVYVGQTMVSFSVRWAEHVDKIPNFFYDPHRSKLYLDKDTKYIVLKQLDSSLSQKIFLKYEHEAHNFYKSKGWHVVSTTFYKDATHYVPCSHTILEPLRGLEPPTSRLRSDCSTD